MYLTNSIDQVAGTATIEELIEDFEKRGSDARLNFSQVLFYISLYHLVVTPEQVARLHNAQGDKRYAAYERAKRDRDFMSERSHIHYAAGHYAKARELRKGYFPMGCMVW